jgi:hypothetical protein
MFATLAWAAHELDERAVGRFLARPRHHLVSQNLMPEVQRVHEHRPNDLPKGFEIRCSSDAVREIGDPDFVKIQRQLREME